MNFKDLQCELLRAMRGDRSQQGLSTKLGFGFNQVYRWERGLLDIRWEDFVRFCHCVDGDLKGTFELFMEQNLPDLKASTIVRLLMNVHKPAVVAKHIGRPTRVLNRWLSGESDPYLVDVLLLMYRSTNLLLEFCFKLAGERNLPSFSKEILARQLEREFHFLYPAFGAVVRTFELTEYEQMTSHSDAYIARKINLPVAQVKALLHDAQAKGLIKKRQGKFTVTNKSLTVRGNVEGRKNILRHWLKVQADALSLKDPFVDHTNKFSYLVFTTNEVTYAKVQALTKEFQRSVHMALHHDDNRAGRAPLDRVILLQHTLLNLEEK